MKEMASPDLGRRRTITGIAAGAAVVPLMRANTGLGKSRHERLLRPPGALDEPDFLARCIRCGECMKVCPNNALHPTLVEAGLEGFGRPRWCPASATASRVACFAPKFAPREQSGRLRRKKKAGWWAWARHRISPSSWERHFMIAGAACPGPWPPNALCARSGAPFAQSDLCRGGPGCGLGRKDEDTETAPRRSQPLCGLRRLRIRLPAPGTPCRLRDKHWRKPLASSQILLTRK